MGWFPRAVVTTEDMLSLMLALMPTHSQYGHTRNYAHTRGNANDDDKRCLELLMLDTIANAIASAGANLNATTNATAGTSRLLKINDSAIAEAHTCADTDAKHNDSDKRISPR